MEKQAFKRLTKGVCNTIKSESTSKTFDRDILPTNDLRRWSMIQKSLKDFKKCPCYQDFHKTVTSYNETKNGFFWAFDYFTNNDLPEDNSFNKLLGDIAEEALKLPDFFHNKKISILSKNKDCQVTFSEEEICCLLANALFCTYANTRDRKTQGNSWGKGRNLKQPRGGSTSFTSEEKTLRMPTINFFNLLGKDRSGDSHDPDERLKAEKLKCIFRYFRAIIERRSTSKVKRYVTFHRQVLTNSPNWDKSTKKLSAVQVEKEGFIEDAQCLLQVDFANKFVGGGVLGRGCVQEEIRFMICPELIVSRLITEELGERECLIVTGAERFSNCDGYSRNFKFAGDYEDLTPMDDHGRLLCQVLMMDALNFSYEKEQFDKNLILRELNKAYCGFYSKTIKEEERPAIATGNWGCGAFKGNKELKFLIQLMASSEANRDMSYFTFNDEDLTHNLKSMYDWLKESDIHVGELFSKICDVIKSEKLEGPENHVKLFHHLGLHKSSPESSMEEDDIESHDAVPSHGENAFFGAFNF